ncbi:hypothetical protein ACFQ51_54535 [Streptomyces kaempferi]
MKVHAGTPVPEPTCFPVAEEIGLLGIAANLSAEEQNAAIKRVQRILADVYHKEVSALGILATVSAREGQQAEVEIKTTAYRLAVGLDAGHPETIHEPSSTCDLHNNSDSMQGLHPSFHQVEPLPLKGRDDVASRTSGQRDHIIGEPSDRLIAGAQEPRGAWKAFALRVKNGHARARLGPGKKRAFRQQFSGLPQL